MAAPKTSRRSASAYLSLISQKEVSQKDAQEVLTTAFLAHDYIDCIKNLTGWKIDPQAYVDGLDQMLNTLEHGSEVYYRCLQALRKTCGIYGIPPASFSVSQRLTLVTTGGAGRPFASGGFYDVWKARGDDGQIFAIKHFRTYETDDLTRTKKKYCKAVIICKQIRHENVLNIEGNAPELFELSIVSRWIDNGNLLDYVKTRTQIDRSSLLVGITRGLHHLHSNELIHGGLKISNILIDSKGNPLLADFGLSSITRNGISDDASALCGRSMIRWTAPELLDVFTDKRKRQSPTVKSDMYALSMVIIELYTGNVPFSNSSDPIVIFRVINGERPPKPDSVEVLGLNPTVWELTKRCWHKNPAKRPETSEILAYLEGRKAIPPPSFLKRLKHILTCYLTPSSCFSMGKRG